MLLSSLTGCLVPAGSGASSHEDSSSDFMVGDKVIQTFNNYDKEVFNGDVGFVVAVNPRESRLTVQFPALEPGDSLGHLHRMGHGNRSSEYLIRSWGLMCRCALGRAG